MKFLIKLLEKSFWLSFFLKRSGEKFMIFLIKLLPNLEISGTDYQKDNFVIYSEGEKFS